MSGGRAQRTPPQEPAPPPPVPAAKHTAPAARDAHPLPSIPMAATATDDRIVELLGDDADSLLAHTSRTIDRSLLHLPGPDFVDRVYADTDRSTATLRNLQSLFAHGRLGGTGYVSILPVDQGIEHSAGASFAPNPIYFDPRGDRRARDRGRHATRSPRRSACSAPSAAATPTSIPFIVKLNHNELLTYPNRFDQVMFASVQRAWELGAAGVGATIYFGSEESTRQLVEVSHAFEEAHQLGMFTVLWCYLRNPAFKQDGVDYHLSADLTGQANHLGVTIEADIIKQKMPGEQRRLQRRSVTGLRQDLQARLLRAHQRPPDRPLPLPGGQLLHGPRRADQQRRRLIGRDRPRRGGAHRGDQQARRRHRPDQRPQGLPAPDERGRRAAATRSRTSTSRPRSRSRSRRRPRRPSRRSAPRRVVRGSQPSARGRLRGVADRRGLLPRAHEGLFDANRLAAIESDGGERDRRRARARVCPTPLART